MIPVGRCSDGKSEQMRIKAFSVHLKLNIQGKFSSLMTGESNCSVFEDGRQNMNAGKSKSLVYKTRKRPERSGHGLTIQCLMMGDQELGL